MKALQHWAHRIANWRPEISVEALCLWTALYIAVFCNQSFWEMALAGRPLVSAEGLRLLFGAGVALIAMHLLLLLCLSHRWIVKPLIALLLVTTALAAFYQDRYRVFLDADMLRNILHTEYREARELITWSMIQKVLWLTALPLLVLWRVRIRRRVWTHALLVRGLAISGAIGMLACGLLFAFRDLSALMRNHKEVRYLVTPGNFLYASARVLWSDAHTAGRVVKPVGTDARVVSRSAAAKPRLLVIVVGETVRAQNWGLNGYARDTTPKLRALDVINFAQVSSCGTATEVSLPCMFSAVGRRDYDEDRIRGEQSLLHVLTHAGIATLWRDNQTGCKGVCAGLPFQQLHAEETPGLCAKGLCYDEILLQDFQAQIDAVPGDLVVVLHPLGNHGPSYSARYPEAFRRFVPTCANADLGQCSREEVINSYDNAVLYADHFVAETIGLLKQQTTRDSALIYVSDHGESLGEHNLFLHGLPWAIAPKEQTSVPMVAWLSPALQSASGINIDCLRRSASQPRSHDNLFHSALGLMDVSSSVYEPKLDIFSSCRDATESRLAVDQVPAVPAVL